MTDILPRATRVLSAGHWVERTARDTVTLDFDERFRRRRRYTTTSGSAFLLDLDEAVALREGDGLLLEGGGVILVRAAPEPMLQVTASTPELLMRLAWHLGNRHLPTQIEGTRILIREDHVIAAMLRGLGATVEAVQAPFHPEGGAYGEHKGHHHHGHDHDHEH